MRPRLPSTDVKAAGYAEDHKEEFLGYEAFCNNAFGSPGEFGPGWPAQGSLSTRSTHLTHSGVSLNSQWDEKTFKHAGILQMGCGASPSLHEQHCLDINSIFKSEDTDQSAASEQLPARNFDNLSSSLEEDFLVEGLNVENLQTVPVWPENLPPPSFNVDGDRSPGYSTPHVSPNARAVPPTYTCHRPVQQELPSNSYGVWCHPTCDVPFIASPSVGSKPVTSDRDHWSGSWKPDEDAKINLENRKRKMQWEDSASNSSEDTAILGAATRLLTTGEPLYSGVSGVQGQGADSNKQGLINRSLWNKKHALFNQKATLQLLRQAIASHEDLTGTRSKEVTHRVLEVERKLLGLARAHSHQQIECLERQLQNLEVEEMNMLRAANETDQVFNQSGCDNFKGFPCKANDDSWSFAV